MEKLGEFPNLLDKSYKKLWKKFRKEVQKTLRNFRKESTPMEILCDTPKHLKGEARGSEKNPLQKV